MTEQVFFSMMDSPVGRLMLTGREDALTGVYFDSDVLPHQPLDSWVQDKRPLAAAIQQLEEYFAGKCKCFDLPLAPEGTPFQRRVWDALTRIPFGTTMSYGELARSIGMPTGMRAVGSANGRNPLSIVVPCHRVIGADGSLTGYGGGIDRKRWLLQFERDIVTGVERQDAQALHYGQPAR